MASDDDDDKLILPASPWPLVAGHVALLGLHVLDGAIAVVALQLAPPPWEGAGQPMTTPRVWASGLAVFATVASVLASTFLTVVVWRLVTTFRKWPPGRTRAALFAGLGLAHAVACGVAIAAISVWITVTLLG